MVLRIRTYWRSGYSQIKNTITLKRYRSDQWNISQASNQNSLLLKLLHPLTIILISLVSRIDLKQKKLNQNHHLKRLLMRSKLIIWKLSPPLSWIYQLFRHLTRKFIRLLWTTALNQQQSNLNQHFKRLLMGSKIIIWKVSPPLQWIHKLSYPLKRRLVRFVSTAALKQKNSNQN